MKRWSDLLGPTRVPCSILAPACVLVGLGTAVWTAGRISVPHFLLALVGGLAAHLSVNALKECFHFRSGLDARTQRTPFGGGSGTLPAKPELARAALATGLVALAVTGLIGLYFVWQQGWGCWGCWSSPPTPPGSPTPRCCRLSPPAWVLAP